jgi:hypothetical protein
MHVRYSAPEQIVAPIRLQLLTFTARSSFSGNN